MSQFIYRKFPDIRMRRLRSNNFIRKLVQESQLLVTDLIYPLFIIEGHNKKQAIPSMPSISRITIDLLLKEIQQIAQLGIPAIALFPVLEAKIKTPLGEYAYHDEGLLQRAIIAVKSQFPELGVIADVALDPYTTHGHDGIIETTSGEILNDETTEILVKQALSLARAGVDIVAPSDMMDGRIGKIRAAFEQNGFNHTKILAYSAKYASNYYSPFRDAVGSKKNLGQTDKKTYQMDPANTNEALHEVALDLQEGADIVMVKPALPYLDIISLVKKTFKVPKFAYQVSGEYSLLKAAVQNGWVAEQQIVLETLTCIKRAGANAILSYYAREVAEWLHLRT